ncbi:Peptide deformylase [hydrothermal vent metagenome]|uniref:Peptide deformylase n=1 Tax=hydrothermal vent metagenome TaxID=652676 RepID=A0A3B1CIW9_9ZZZZ
MAVLEVAKLGNPILRKIAAPLTADMCNDPDFQTFLDDMIETMEEMDGIGLAAPQVGHSKQLVILKSTGNNRYPDAPNHPLMILINPKLTHHSEEMIEGWEGCLSVEDLRGKVWRHNKVTVSGFDRKMNPLSFEAEGFLAVVLQHEIDHLSGKVFLDRMRGFSTLTHLAEFDQYWRSPSPQEVTV